VLQLPVATQHAEHIEIRHVARADSRVALNRVAVKPGVASILVPNQGAAMLWQALRSTAVELSIALAQSFRRLQAHQPHSLPADAGTVEPSFNTGILTAPLPNHSAAPAKKIAIKAA
jgi:hypothetical protein